MFTVEHGTVRRSIHHNVFIAYIKQENDPGFFKCPIIENDPSPEFADIYTRIVNEDYGPIGDIQPEEELTPVPLEPTSYEPEDVITGLPPDTTISEPVPQIQRFELWRVKRALRDIPATNSFKAYVEYSGIVVNDDESRPIPLDRLSGFDQVSFAIRLTDNVSLKDFWRDGIYVYDNSPNYKAFASILELTPQQVVDLQNNINSYVV